VSNSEYFLVLFVTYIILTPQISTIRRIFTDAGILSRTVERAGDRLWPITGPAAGQ
jgi:hypothetical protein